jgi:hypothetical protein
VADTDSVTDKLRHNARWLFVGTILIGLVGWLAGRDPAMLMPLLGAECVVLGIGEGSNVGKRATTKPELLATAKVDT